MIQRGLTIGLSCFVCVVCVSCGWFVASSAASVVFEDFENTSINQDGSPDMQAGSHPWEMITDFDFVRPTESAKDIEVNFPPGWSGYPGAVKKCSIQEFTTLPSSGVGAPFSGANCPIESQVGIAEFKTSADKTAKNYNVNLYNLVAPPGVPAELGANITGIPIIFQASVRSGEDNGLTVSVHNASQSLHFYGARILTWGVPADHSHDDFRGACLGGLGESVATAEHKCPSGEAPRPFLTQPTSCPNIAPVTRIKASSWEEPGRAVEGAPAANRDPEGNVVGLLGCEQLGFRPSLTISPDTTYADTPAGLTAEVAVPQDGLLVADGLASATLRNTTVVLPEGMAINPGQAAGLAACGPAESGVGTEGAPTCPNASTVGTAELETPLLPDKIKGNIYVLQSNPPALQILVALSGDGVNLKLVGDVSLDTSTGQITTTFSNTPQLPFTDFKLTFSGGAQAALVTPTRCGAHTTTAEFTPWSAPFSPAARFAIDFGIDRGPGGNPCADPLPFAPTMEAGATNPQAGGYTNFSLLLERGDGQQRIDSLKFKTPEGLLAMIRTVPLCPGAQAAAGTCSESSEIGHTVVAAGPGPFPLIVPQPGRPAAPIYVTGPYKGEPYGLSIAVPVVVGPFNLGTVVVRSSIAVDRHTAQLTITTDPLPSILDGIPTDLRTINAVIDRGGFMFNPTDCAPQSFEGAARSLEGQTAALASRFQVGACRSLEFKPDFRVSTSGKTSRANGASLNARVLYPSTAPGTGQATAQSNIASVKVDLPKQLPSRLKTLQKACEAKVFDANPAACPKASLIGHATAVTPVLAGKLTGPVYFVSHGGAAFPDLIIVLQGSGATVDLVAGTFISKSGITSSTFKQVPDVPISSFDLTLPKGPFSALAANGKLCASKLAMPTAFTAQNGLVIKQSTKIKVTACPKAKKHLRR